MSRKPMLALALVLVAGAVLLVLALELAGRDPAAVAAAFVAGAAGDSARLGVTLLRATPLLLAGLGVLLAFRAGLWNIGAEGQLLAGALAAVFVATRPGLPGGFLLPVLAGAAGGALWGALAGGLRAAFGVPEVISTLLLNFVAIELRSWLVLGPMREAAGQYPQTDAVPAAARLPAVGLVPSALLGGIAIAMALHVLIYRTRAGLELRAAGLNPGAAHAQGVRVRAMALTTLTLSGAIAGCAGASEILGSIGRVYEGYAPGHGYTAIAVALLGRLEPLLAVPSALLFGALAAGSERMELVAGVPAVLSLVVQAWVVLGSVLAGRRSESGVTEVQP